jgi:hypothetical protein
MLKERLHFNIGVAICLIIVPLAYISLQTHVPTLTWNCDSSNLTSKYLLHHRLNDILEMSRLSALVPYTYSLNSEKTQYPYFNTCATVFGPNHCPTSFPSDAPINAIWWIEYAAARRSSNMCRIWRYAGLIVSGSQHQSRPVQCKIHIENY